MFIFPVHLFRPRRVMARIIGAGLSGGETMSGDDARAANDYGGRWQIEFSGITLNTPRLIAAWDAWTGYLDHGATPVLVPLLSISTAPRAWLGNKPQPVPPLIWDDPVFPEAVDYGSPVMEFEFVDPSAAGDRHVFLSAVTGSPLVGGEVFEVDGRAHQIIRQVDVGKYLIAPTLRNPVFDYDEPDFGWPCVIARLEPTGDEGLSIENGNAADPSITFVEMLGVSL